MQEDALDDESTLRFPRSDLPLLEYSVDRSTALPKGIQRRAVGIEVMRFQLSAGADVKPLRSEPSCDTRQS